MRGVHRGLLRLGSGHGGEQAADEFLDLGVVAGGEVGEHEMLEGEPDLGEAGSDGDEHDEPEMVDGAVDADEQQRCELHEDAGGEKADAFAERYGFWAGAGEALGGDYAFSYIGGSVHPLAATTCSVFSFMTPIVCSAARFGCTDARIPQMRFPSRSLVPPGVWAVGRLSVSCSARKPAGLNLDSAVGHRGR